MIPDEIYNEAIAIWLVRNNYDLKRLHGHKRNKSLTEKEFAGFISDVSFGVTPLGCSTCGDGGDACIEFRFKNSYYEHELRRYGNSVFELIKECCSIMDELV